MAIRRDERFHRYGPMVLAGTAIAFAIAYEAAKHHVVSGFTVLFFVVLIGTVMLHEISHGVVALWCGDTTARDAGRLTLNPLKHIDPIGTVLLPVLLLLTTGSAFGWAKPVPVSIGRLRHPRNQAVLVGLAGPALNIVLALAAGLALRASTNAGLDLPNSFGFSSFQSWFGHWNVLDQILFMIGYVNVLIAAFNLIPIPPLDGSAVLERLLPASALPAYYRMRMLSMVLVFALVFLAPGVLDTIFNQAITWWEQLVF